MSPNKYLVLVSFVLCSFWLPRTAQAQDYSITNVTLSRTTIVTYSNQIDNVVATVSINPPVAANSSVSVTGQCQTTLCAFNGNIVISGGFSSGSTTVGGLFPVNTTTGDTLKATLCNFDGTCSNFSVGITLQPNTPTLSGLPSSVIGGQQFGGQISFVAPGSATNPPLSASIMASPSLVSGTCTVQSGQTGGSCQLNSVGVTTATTVALTPFYNPQNGPTVTGNSVNVVLTPPPPPQEPSFPCPTGQCEGQAGAPINLTNGNTWVTQHDYSLPGLGGGLSLDRTWNSLWATSFRSGLPVSGMFGHSWRSTYEEALVSSGSAIQYFRSNGDDWTFQSSGSSYVLTTPPNEHATLSFNGTQYTMVFPDGTQHLFNSSGFLTTIVDRNANQVSLTYDGSNRITQVTDAASRTLTFAYTNSSFPSLATSATDAAGTVATYTYDVSGRLQQVLYPDSSQLNFAYDGNNLLTSVTDALSKVIESHTYDSQRRGITSQRANGVNLVTASYPSSGTTTLTDSLGNTTNYGYGTINLATHVIGTVSGPTCSTCGAATTSTFGYDGSGNRNSSTDANGNNTAFTFDSNSNVLTRSITVNGVPLTWTYTYNSFSEVLTAQDPMGFVTTNTYDANGNLLTVTTPSPDGGTTPGSVTTFTYDTKGQLLTIKDPLNQITTIAYYPTGLINTITDFQNNVTTYTYDARGNRLTSKDALNNTTQFQYDAMNRLKKIIYPDTTNTQFAYDTRGRRITVTDQNSKVTTYNYDDADRVTSVKDAANNTTTYGYDTESNLTSIKDANTHTTNFHYNPNRWVDKTTFPSGLIENYGYDLNGNMTSKTDRKNQQIAYTYDPLNRLTKKTYPDSTTVNYTYDNDSRLTQVADPTGTYSFSFDNMGRLTGTTTSYSFLTGRNFTTAYGYDAASNRTSFTDPESGATAYVYDTLNRLQTLTPPAAYGTGSFGFGYDADSRRTSFTRPNSVNTTYGYDTLSRLLNVTHKKGTSTLDGVTYTLDNAGNRLTKAPLPSGTATNFTYDSIYELLTAKQGNSTKESYTYDPVGNRLTSSGTSYTNNSSNELTAVGSNTTYTFDNNGSRLTKVVSGHGGGTTTYAWDFENRLTSVTLPGTGGTVSFKYDPFGRRIYKSSSSATSIYSYDGDNLIEETNSSGAVVSRYQQGLNIDEPLARLHPGDSSFYYEADGLGSVTSLTSSTGSVVNTYTYDSFGNLTASTGTTTNFFRYTAREIDTEIGLYYYRARYYDEETGRFLSEDPGGFVTGIDFYTYAGNNSVNLIDPLGLQGGGPWHPPVGVHTKCTEADDCTAIKGKMYLLERMIASHTGWDRAMPRPRGGNKHARDIADLWTQYARCQELYLEKDCDNCKKKPWPPVPVPIVGPVLDKITDPILDLLQGLWEDLKHMDPPRLGPRPIPVPIPVPIPIPIPI